MSRRPEPEHARRAPLRPATDPHTLNTALRAWASAIDAVSDLVFMHDEGGCLMRVNRAYAERAGTRPGELLGRPFRMVMPEAGEAPEIGRDADWHLLRLVAVCMIALEGAVR